MLSFDTRRVFDAKSAAGASAGAAAASGGVIKELSPAALKVAAQPAASAYSPIVLAGAVRGIEFVLVVLVGTAVYFWHVVPVDGFEWLYMAAIGAIGLMATLAFQAADIYQVQAFRGYEKQYFRLMSAWSVVFLLAIGATFFLKIGDQVSRFWLGAFYVAGLVVLVGFRRCLFLLVRSWTRQGRLDRRTVVVGADEKGEALIKSLAAQRDSDVRVVGVFDDRGDQRASSTVAGRPKLGSVDELVEFARRTRIDL